MDRRAGIILIFGIAAFLLVTVASVVLAIPKNTISIQNVQRISILNNFLLSTDEVLRLIGMKLQGPKLKLNLNQAEKNLLRSRLVKSARLYLRGKAIIIRIEEYRPLVRVLFDDETFWLCSDGKVIKADLKKDKGAVFDEVRRQFAIRIATKDYLNKPKLTALLVHLAKKLQSQAGARLKEMRLDMASNLELITDKGLPIRLGTLDEEANLKVDVVPQILRVTSNKERKIRFVEIKSPELAIIKYES